MRKQDFMRAIKIYKELGDFNGCEIDVVLAVLDTVIDNLIDLKTFIEESIGGNKNG